jgi:osmotically-inducible protein OsmY
MAAADDSTIAEAIAHAVRRNPEIPDTVEPKVAQGLVTLEGRVRWAFQADEAKRVVESVNGVRGVTSAVTVELGPGMPRRIDADLAKNP